MAEPIDIAFALLKGGKDLDEWRDAFRDKSTGKRHKVHPIYHDWYRKRRNSAKPTGTLRTGPEGLSPDATEQDARDFMRINTDREHEEDMPPAPLNPIDAMRFAAINSARIGSDYKAAVRMAQAEQMQGKQLQDMFEAQGIPVKNTISEDLDMNIHEPRREPIEDMDDEWKDLLAQHTKWYKFKNREQ
tara:strand:- start:661 stop:1224 length:564 start_codon:yes stop_codon:yes gene_type:complete